MNENVKTPSEKKSYEPPQGASGKGTCGTGTDYQYVADWLVLRKKEKPVAEMFHVGYTATPHDPKRPVTFVFNGGPGAAAAYLHLGALGPQRLVFSEKGDIEPPPAKLVPNTEGWLPFTDLVFVDPVGTGFSRIIEEDGEAKKEAGKEKDDKEFYKVNRDLDALGEFISRYLSKNHRWGSPIYIAGESYGGFRVARLARKLQEEFGISLSGAILISPAIEMSLLWGSDYDVVPWASLFPSIAAASLHHKKSNSKENIETLLKRAEKFATQDLAAWLFAGDDYPKEKRAAVIKEMAGLTGLSEAYIAERRGRISAQQYTRELLKEERKVLGLYDASMTTFDAFPDRDSFVGGDPTLAGITRVFTAGINDHLRQALKVESERDYNLLNFDVFNSWKVDGNRHGLESYLGSTDELRYGLSLNPHMKVVISHGYYDLITPYYASSRLPGLMKLGKEQKNRVLIKHFDGGHMFYMWDRSRREFRDFIRDSVYRA